MQKTPHRDATEGSQPGGPISRILSADRSLHLAAYAGTMLLTILAKSYHFGNDDHYYYFPFIRRLFDESFLRNDWFAQRDITGPHGFIYAWLQGGLGELISWPLAGLIIFLVTWFFVFDAMVRIGRTVCGRRAVGYVAAVLMILVLDREILGKHLYTGQALPRELANGVALYGLLAWLRSRWVAGGLLLAGATLIHIVTGGEPAVIFIAAVLIQALLVRRYPPGLLKGVIAWAVIVVPYGLFSYLWLHGAPSAEGADLATWARIFAWMRCPHHYVPSEMLGARYFMHAVEVALAAWAWYALSRDVPEERRAAWQRLGLIIPITIVVMIGYWFLVEVLHVYHVIKLQALVNSYWVRVACAVGAAALLVRSTDKLKGRPALVGAVVVVSLVATVAVFSFWQILHGRELFPLPWQKPFVLPLAWAFAIVGLAATSRVPDRVLDRFSIRVARWGMTAAVVMFLVSMVTLWLAWLSFSALIPLDGDTYRWEKVLPPFQTIGLIVYLTLAASPGAQQVLTRRAYWCLATCVLALGLLFGFGVYYQHYPIRSIPRFRQVMQPLGPAPNNRVFDWIRSNTPRDAVFLIPPLLDGVQLEAERAIVFSYRTYPHDISGTFEWFRRFQAVTHIDSTPQTWPSHGWYGLSIVENAYNGLTTDQVVGVARRYGASYVIRIDEPEPLDLPVVLSQVHAWSNWTVYSIPADTSQAGAR